MRAGAVISALLLLALSRLAAAAPEAWRHCYLAAIRAVAQPAHDSAVELELDTIPEVMSVLTTENGKVSGLFGKKGVPKWFSKWAKEHIPGYRNAGEIPWEKVPLQEQSDLINTASDARGKDFFDDRRIRGLKTKDRVRLTFKEPTDFLGKKYPAGTHEIDVSKFLRPVVEYRGPDDVKAIGGVELHFRGLEPSGDLSADARTFEMGLGVEPTHQHLHMVAPLPIRALTEAPALEAARLGDFVRRANQAAEMVDIIHDGGGIADVVRGDVTFFGSFKPEDLEGVTQYFLDLGGGKSPKIGDDFKMGWVGMRGSDKYDQPGLWGLEYRAIHRNSRMANHQPVLNALQQTMGRADLGMDPARFKAWFESRPKIVRAPGRVSEAWYNQPWEKLYRNARPKVRAALSKIDAAKLQVLGDHFAGEVKMLIHDWASDPLFFDQPALLEKIEREQVRGLARIMKSENTRPVLRDFLIDSGIYEETLKSIGVSVRVK